MLERNQDRSGIEKAATIKSKNKIGVGVYIRIEYKKKWYRAKIIEMTTDNIAIKLWTPFRTKLFDIPRKPNWLNLVLDHKVYADDHHFPKWVKIGKNICIIHYQKSIQYYKIGDIYGENIVLYSITQDINNKTIQLTTKTTTFHQLMQSKENHYVYNPRKTTIMYTCPHSIHNDQLLKDFFAAKSNKKNSKSTSKQLISNFGGEFVKDEKNMYLSQFIHCSSNRYKKYVFAQEIFPSEVKMIILSYLQQQNMYICPDTPCKKYCNISDSEMHFGYMFAVNFGLMFSMNTNLWIIGFEICWNGVITEIVNNSLYLLDFTDNKILHQAQQCQDNLLQQLYNVEYYFDKPIELKAKGSKYKFGFTARLDPLASFKAHDTPWNITNGEMNFVENWKCFSRIRWTQFRNMDTNNGAKGFLKGTSSFDWGLEFYPHISFLLA